MADPLKISMYVGIAAVVLGLICLGAVAWGNAGSRNLVLATSTLAAAILLFVIQLPFELRSRSEVDLFSAELTVDRATPMIRLWNYPDGPGLSSGSRLLRETEASSYLANRDRSRFDGDRERLTLDMILYNFVAYLGAEQFDWQLKRTVLRGNSIGTLFQAQAVSRDTECTAFAPAELQEKLRAVGNAFADVPLLVWSGRLCLPPGATLTVGEQSLEIRTPFCRISFTLEPSGAVWSAKPGTRGEVPQLPNGDPQLETRLTGIRSLVEFSWIRAQHPDLKKYEDWSQRLVKGARLWFEGRSGIEN